MLFFLSNTRTRWQLSLQIMPQLKASSQEFGDKAFFEYQNLAQKHFPITLAFA